MSSTVLGKVMVIKKKIEVVLALKELIVYGRK